MASRGMPKHHDTAGFVLHDVVAAGVAQFLHRPCAVGAHAGQHHAQRVRAHHPRGRLEQHLDRRLVAVDRLAVAHAGDVVGARAFDRQVEAARRDVGMAGQHTLAVARFGHADAAQVSSRAA
jgi:hypothetical protein